MWIEIELDPTAGGGGLTLTATLRQNGAVARTVALAELDANGDPEAGTGYYAADPAALDPPLARGDYSAAVHDADGRLRGTGNFAWPGTSVSTPGSEGWQPGA